MTSQFSPKVSEVLAYSREEAARLASRWVGPEHLLLGLLRMKEGPVIGLFHRLNLNLQSVKTELENKVREDEISRPIYTSELVLNEKASNILKLAVLEARIQRSNKVEEQHLLLAILHDAVNNGAKEVLEAEPTAAPTAVSTVEPTAAPTTEPADSVTEQDADGAPMEDNVQGTGNLILAWVERRRYSAW